MALAGWGAGSLGATAGRSGPGTADGPTWLFQLMVAFVPAFAEGAGAAEVVRGDLAIGRLRAVIDAQVAGGDGWCKLRFGAAA